MKEIVEKFYEALANLDGDAMADCYHKEIEFQDPAFGVLKGERAGNMWKMLCNSQKGKDFKINLTNIKCTDNEGSSNLDAYYTFSKTGRRVHNRITSSFRFKEGKIISHKDEFDLYRWSRQALGLTGYILGWTGYFKNKFQAQSLKLLERYEEKTGLP